MKSVLMQLYNGEINPGAQSSPETEEHRKLQESRFYHYQSFADALHTLDPTLEQQFIDIIMDEQMDFLPHEQAQAFIDGFRLGAKIMLEVLQSPEQQP